MRILILLLMMSTIAQAGWGKKWKISAISLIAANTVDIHSSVGEFELNPLLRGPGGIFSVKKAVIIKSVAIGGLLLFQAIRLRKYPDEVKSYTIINTAATGITFVVAARNYRLRK